MPKYKRWILSLGLILAALATFVWASISFAQASRPIIPGLSSATSIPQSGQQVSLPIDTGINRVGEDLSLYQGLFDDVWTPSAVVRGEDGSIHLVAEIFESGQPDVYYVRSKGDVILELENLSHNSTTSIHPDLYLTESEVHVVWQDDQSGADQIYYRRKGGDDWLPEQQITASSVGAYAPKLMIAQGGRLQFQWTEYISKRIDTYQCTWTGQSCINQSKVYSLGLGPENLKSTQATESLRMLAFLKDGEIWTIREDGSGLKHVTSSSGRVYAFSWSPDGQQFAYTYLTDEMNQWCDIYVINTDGTGQRRLTTNIHASRWGIDWHENKIAFVRIMTDSLYIRISYVATTGGVDDISANIENYGIGFNLFSNPRLRWSPDGQWVALSHGLASGVASLSGLQHDTCCWFQPSWSQDSDHLIYDNDHIRIRKYFPSTGSSTLLSSVDAYFPTYSPDNQLITYGSPYLRRMNGNNTGHVTIVYDKAASMDWSLTGDRIAYVSWYDNDTSFPGIYGIYVIGVNGGSRRQLVSGYAENPAWQPAVVSYSVSGRVTTAQGAPIPDVTISDGQGRTATTNVDGYYTLAGLSPGTYTISASLPGWTFAPDPLPNTHHSQPIVITVPPEKRDVDFKGYDREPIVFVHGWQGGFDPLCPNHDKRFFQDMDHYFESVDNDLATAGYYVKHASLMTWTCWTESLNANAVWLKDTIDRAKTATGRDSVILIAHSMGGLVSRAYIEGDSYNRDVSQLFTFGSPHLGVPADIIAVMLGGDVGAWGLGKYCELFGPAVCEFTTEGMHVFNLTHSSRSDVEYYLVSGAANPWKLNTLGLLAYSALGGWTGVGNDAAVQQFSGIGLLGSHHRFRTDEAHRSSVGDPNYFSNRDEGGSHSYRECLSPVLLDDDEGTTCGEQSTLMSAAQPQDTLTTSHSPMQYGILLPAQSSDHDLTLEGGSSLIATRWTVGTVEVSLIDPYGTVIDPTYAANHPDQVTYVADEGIAIYSLTDAEAGVWQVRLQAGEGIPDEGVNYNLLAFIDSALNLFTESDHLWYAPGDIASLTVTLSPPPVTAEISATILLADDASEMVELAAVGGGKYQGSYTIPNVPGYAEARFIATGSIADGNPFERGQSTVFQISPNSAELSGVYNDTPQPRSPGSNYYGSLNVTSGIKASIATTITLSADLVDENGMVVAHANSTTAVNPGDSSLSLYFSGEDIYAARRDGPYTLTHVLLIDQRGAALVLDQADDVHVTAEYKYIDFGFENVFLPLILRQAYHVHGVTPTPTVTLTPTVPTLTHTPTPTPTVKPPFQPTATPTRTPTITPTPTSTLTPTPSLTPSPTPTVTPESSSDPVVVVEIEEGSIIQPLAIGSDGNASSCKYIHTIDDWSNGGVQLTFEAPSDGEYYLWTRARGQGWGTNSFFMAVDNANEIHFEIVPVNETDWIWDWQRLYQEDGSFPFYLTAGQHTIRFRSREADADLDAFVVAQNQEFEPDEITTCDQSSANLIELEEGYINQPMGVERDTSASSCEFIHTTNAWGNGSATVTFNVQSSSEYYLWARGRGHSWGTNSFFMSIDNTDEIHFEIVPVNETDWIWDWQRLYQNDGSFPFYLNTGQHTVRFRSREPDADLDVFTFTDNPAIVPDEVNVCSSQKLTP